MYELYLTRRQTGIFVPSSPLPSTHNITINEMEFNDNKTFLIRFTATTDDDQIIEWIYHPGALARVGSSAMEFATAVLKFGLIGWAVTGLKSQGQLRESRMLSKYHSMANQKGVPLPEPIKNFLSSDQQMQRGIAHLMDAKKYPTEGYYVYDALEIEGKISYANLQFRPHSSSTGR